MTMATSTLLVTGASGQLGRRVIELLLDQKAGPIVATTRSPEKVADLRARGVDVRGASFDSETELAAAFKGVERALLISTDTVDAPGKRLAQHQRAVRALEAAGARHVVYTSMPKPDGSPVTIAPDHAGTEAALAASKLDYTVLRNNLYADLFLATLPPAIASGQIVDSRSNGRAAFVTREDCARAAAGALADRAAAGRRTLDVTGAEALTSDEVAAIVSEVVGKKIGHTSVPVDALVQGLVSHGLPKFAAEIYASFDVAIARGDLATVTGAVQTLTGSAPQRLRDFLAANRHALV
jgi:NAD(P)H dehydrogenase (quinone)